MSWQVGDLAWQNDSLPYCAMCEEDAKGYLCGGGEGVLTVVSVSPPEVWFGETHGALKFATDHPGELPWCSCIFRKVVRDEREACEPEFVTLLKRAKRQVPA